MSTKNILPILFILLSNIAFAQLGHFDNSFDADGITTFGSAAYEYSINDVALQADGKIVSCGFADDGTNTFMFVSRHLTNGSIDNNFGTNGVYIVPPPPLGDTRIDGEAIALEIQTDGKIVLAGQYLNQTQDDYWSCVVRILSTGAIDVSFTADGHSFLVSPNNYNDYILDIAIQTDGKYLLSGVSKIDGFFHSKALLFRMNANGSLDGSFGVKRYSIAPNSYNRFYSVQLDNNNKIIVGGAGQLSSNVSAIVLRYNSNGSLDNTFGNNGIFYSDSTLDSKICKRVLPLSDGSYYFLGDNANVFIGKLTANGSLNASFGLAGFSEFLISGAHAIGDAVLLDNNEVAICAVDYTTAGSKGLFAKFKSNGDVDSSFGQNVAHTVIPNSFQGTILQSIALQADGKIVGVGDYLNAGDSEGLIARLDMGAPVALASISMSNLISAYPNPCKDAVNINCDETVSKVALYDLAGRQVLKRKCVPSNKFKINLESLRPGSYILRLGTTEGQQYSKLIKKQ